LHRVTGTSFGRYTYSFTGIFLNRYTYSFAPFMRELPKAFLSSDKDLHAKWTRACIDIFQIQGLLRHREGGCECVCGSGGGEGVGAHFFSARFVERDLLQVPHFFVGTLQPL